MEIGTKVRLRSAQYGGYVIGMVGEVRQVEDISGTQTDGQDFYLDHLRVQFSTGETWVTDNEVERVGSEHEINRETDQKIMDVLLWDRTKRQGVCAAWLSNYYRIDAAYIQERLDALKERGMAVQKDPEALFLWFAGDKLIEAQQQRQAKINDLIDRLKGAGKASGA